MSDLSNVHIVVSGNSADANIILNSSHAYVSEEQKVGPQGPAGPAGADGTDGAAGSDGVDGKDSEQSIQANNYKYLPPFNVLTGPADASFMAMFTPGPTQTWSHGPNWFYTYNDWVRGMNFTDAAYNCGGTYFLQLAMYGFTEVPGAPVFDNNNVSIINDISIQKLWVIHTGTLQDEVKLGYDFATMPNDINLNGADGYPGLQAAAVARAMPNYDTIKWDQAKVNDRYNSLQHYTGVDSLVTWDAKFGTVFKYIETLELIHIRRLLLLSSLDPKDISWGDQNFETAWATDFAFDATGAPVSAAMHAFTSFAGAATMAGPFLPKQPVSLERIQLAEFYKKQVPENVLFDLLAASEHMTFSPTPVMTNAGAGNIAEYNKYFRDMLLPTYSYNCGGTYNSTIGMYGFYEISGLSFFDDNNVSILNDVSFQKLMGLHLSSLKNEVDLGWNFAAKPAMPSTWTNIDPSARALAATKIAANPELDLSWGQVKVRNRYNALQELSGVANLVKWEDPNYVNLFEYFEVLELVHIETLLNLSNTPLTDISWGNLPFNDVFRASDYWYRSATDSSLNSKGIDTVSLFANTAKANMPFVPVNAIGADHKLITF